MAAIPPEAHAAGANPSPSNPWITQNPGPAAFPVGPIAASNGARVAMGRRTLVVSTDGKTWRETEIEARGIASGKRGFVAITKDQLMSSVNGSDWKRTADAVGSTVAFGNGRFVVAGPSGVVVTSSDGLTWSHPSNRGAGDVALLVFGKGRFVAAIDGKKPHLAASQDGVHWSVVRRFNSRSEQALLFGNGVFVHANDDGVFTSRDGLRWAAVGNAGMITAQRMFYAGERFVGLIADDDRVSNVCASRDLESWTSLGPVLPLVRRMGFDDGRFYASDDNGVVYGSTDLTRWEAANTASTQWLNAVACGNGWLVAVGDDGAVLRSQDATHWTAIDPITTSRLGAVTFWKGAFIAAGDPGVVLRSTDGRDWTKVPLDSPPHLHALASTDDIVVAVGSAPLFSSDGVVWKSGPGHAGPDFWKAAGGNGRIVAINDDTIVTSADGSHWEKGIAPWSGHRSVQFYDGRFHIEDNEPVGLASVDGKWWKWAPTDVDDRRMPDAAVYTCAFAGLDVRVGEHGLIATRRPRASRKSSSAAEWSYEGKAFAARTYVGEMDRQHVFIMTVASDGRTLSGDYRYVKRKDSLGLKGTISADGTFDLDERTNDGKQTGRFRGKLLGHELVGQWSTPDGSKVLYVDGYQSSLEDIAAKQASFKSAFKDVAGEYEVTTYNDFEGANTMYDCGKEGEKWVCGASCIQQGMREPFDWQVPRFLVDRSYRIEIDHGLTITLLVNGRRFRTIPVEENPMVYFPANGTLVKNVPLQDLAAEESAGRYALECSSDLKTFTLRGHATLTFEKARRSGKLGEPGPGR